MEWFIDKAKREFAKYGFIVCPLTTEQLQYAWKYNVNLTGVYGLGCDVNAGVPFKRAMSNYYNEAMVEATYA